MRLVTRQVHRAIPELDALSDESCRRIIRQVYRLRRVQIATAMIVSCLLSVPATVIAVSAMMHLVGELLWTPRTDWQHSIVITAVIAACIGTPMFVAFRVRDYMLRLGCEWLVERKDRCAACSYPFTGLRAAPDQTVRCPECGTESSPAPHH